MNICRVCRASNDDLVSMDDLLHEESDLTILESIIVCSGAEISKSDGLPYFICDFCLDELKITYIFLQKLQESTEILTRELKSNASLKEDDDEFSQNSFDQDPEPDPELPCKLDSPGPETIEEIYTYVYSDEHDKPKSELEVNVDDIDEPTSDTVISSAVEAEQFEEYLEEERLIEEYEVEYTDEHDFSSGVFEELEVATEENINDDQRNNYEKTTIIEGTSFVKQVRGGYLVKQEDGTLVYQCDSCEKTFKKPDYLSNHVRFVHKKVRPFVCSVCPNSYTSSLRLKEHFRTHTGEKPFECEYCDQAFARNVTLRSHIRTHTKEAPFKCKICGKCFRQDATLRGHMFVHTGIGVPCPVCNKMFARAIDVKKHMGVHDEKKKKKSKFE